MKLPWGLELRLINISSTGLLVEATSKFAPGTSTEFQLSGPDTNLVVAGRFVRSEIASVDSRSVKYRAAAMFANELPLPHGGATAHTSTPKALGTLINDLLANIDRSGRDALRARFAEGLRALVPARAIEITNGVPNATADGESILFTIPSTSGSETLLHATFRRGYELRAEEFRLLRVAAALAAVVVELEKHPEALRDQVAMALAAV